MKKLFSLTLCLCLCGALLAGGLSAAAADLDEILSYDLTVTPYTDSTDYASGSLLIHCAVDWKVLDSTSEGPLEWVQIGLPNSAASDCIALTDNIDQIYPSGDYMHIYFDRSYYSGETIHFEYSWVQAYMYTLEENGGVSFQYTPGWFDSAFTDHMSITWDGSALADRVSFSYELSDGVLLTNTETGGVCTLEAENLPHGATLTAYAIYTGWPVALSEEYSSTGAPDSFDYDDGSYDGGDDAFGAIFAVFMVIVVLFIILRVAAASSRDSWDGGFGVHYVYLGGLYYPAGRDGKPRPGAVGTPHRPAPPPGGRSHGGIGGGGRSGGGFGGGGRSGGGFGGGGCACASSCACACACACAGGGRAGCSVKNLYGAIHMPPKKES